MISKVLWICITITKDFINYLSINLMSCFWYISNAKSSAQKNNFYNIQKKNKILVFVQIYGKIAVDKIFLDHSTGTFVQFYQLYGKTMLSNRLNRKYQFKFLIRDRRYASRDTKLQCRVGFNPTKILECDNLKLMNAERSTLDGTSFS